MATVDGYIICPNGWSSVYHYAVPMDSVPGCMRSLCEIGGSVVRRDEHRLITWKGSTAFMPIHVVDLPDGRRLCRVCERIAAQDAAGLRS